ncbi:MAG: FAD-binding oxidoreductase [Candidatus Helarchaeota archaeon]
MIKDQNPILNELIDLFGSENVIFNADDLKNYNSPYSPYENLPLTVIKPSVPAQFKRLNFLLKRHHIDSLTPRGRGLSTNLGSISTDIVIDMAHFCKNFEIDRENSIITAEAGYYYQDLKKFLANENLRLPIEPVINGTLGGFIASGGYGYGSYQNGSIAHHLRHLTIVLSNGQILQTGTSNVPNFTSGYNLNGIFCGSEGYFGIILEATLELLPLPSYATDLLLSIKKYSQLPKLITSLHKLSSVYNLNLYKGLLDRNPHSLHISIRLEGSHEIVDHDLSILRENSEFSSYDSSLAKDLWTNRLINPNQIPNSKFIFEVIIPVTKLPNFLNYCDKYGSSAYFGVGLNSGSFLLYAFFDSEFDGNKNDEFYSDILKHINEFQIRPPSLESPIPKFVQFAHPHWEMLKEIKPVFDPLYRLKSRKMLF